MFLELNRVAANYRDKGAARLVCDFAIIPCLVALMLTLAYVSRKCPSDHRTSFVYFSTLYAFWCGLFGSCQAFNGEASSGEWSYWVLGQRRPLLPHLLSHFALGFGGALLQMASCVFFMLVFSFFRETSLVHQVANMLFERGGYGLPGYWELMSAGTFGAYHFSILKYLLGGIVAAALSGTCLGLLISAVFRSPQTSLSASVCVIVACTVLSQTSIKGEGNSSSREREFVPVSLAIRQRVQCARDGIEYVRYNDADLTPWKNGGAVELASWLLPQRFFFNLGRIPFLKLNNGSLSGDWQEADQLFNHKLIRREPEKVGETKRDRLSGNVRGCLCPVCIGLVDIVTEVVDDDDEYFVVNPESGSKLPFQLHWLHSARNTAGYWKELLADNGVAFVQSLPPAGTEENRVARQNNQKLIREALANNNGDIRSYVSFFREMALGEFAVVSVQSLVMLAIAFVCIRRKVVFNELR